MKIIHSTGKGRAKNKISKKHDPGQICGRVDGWKEGCKPVLRIDYSNQNGALLFYDQYLVYHQTAGVCVMNIFEAY